MSILWAGGEDIDFPNGVAPGSLGAGFRSSYARITVNASSSGMAKSLPFPGGAVTSAWLTARCGNIGNQTVPASKGLIGFGLSGTNKGLFFGRGSSGGKISLLKYDGSSWTTLATESGDSGVTINAAHRIDMQVVSYGASATVNVYYDSSPVLTFTGDVTVSGMSNFDSVYIHSDGSGNYWWCSEIIAADEDTRGILGLVTMAPTATGTTDNWTGTVPGNINPTSINDANSVFTNTASQDEQANVTDMPSGNFAIKAVVIQARAMSTAGATATNVALGFNSGGTVAVGSPHATTTAWATVMDIFSINPVGSTAWLLSVMNALQINLRSS